jgi:hypothetical protein
MMISYQNLITHAFRVRVYIVVQFTQTRRSCMHMVRGVARGGCGGVTPPIHHRFGKVSARLGKCLLGSANCFRFYRELIVFAVCEIFLVAWDIKSNSYRKNVAKFTKKLWK